MAFIISFTQRVKARFLLAVFDIRQYQQWLIEENLLSLGLAYVVLFSTFTGITIVPVETDNLF